MIEALSQVYGSYATPLSKVFGPVIAPRTYVRALHLFSMFPLGVAYFVALVVMLSLGGSLIWTFIGPIVLIAALFLSRWAGDAEACTIRRVSQIEFQRPPTATDLSQSLRAQLWTRLIDRNSWTGLVYLFVQFPLGIASFTGLVTATALVGSLVGAPAVMALSDATYGFGGIIPEVTTVQGSLILVPFGLMGFVVAIHLINVASAAHATWARFMLASRAKAIPNAPTQLSPEPSGPTGGHPAALPEDRLVWESSQPAGQLTGLASLINREQEVLGLIARGHSNADIAEAFFISEGTVKTLVKRVLSKLEARDRTQAAVYAYDIGFVKPGDTGRTAPEPLRLEDYRAG
jgi:DNA-binding CsgD family transcriptional regulator